MWLYESLVKVWVQSIEETKTLSWTVHKGLAVKQFLHQTLRGTVVHRYTANGQIAPRHDRVLFEHRKMLHHLSYQREASSE